MGPATKKRDTCQFGCLEGRRTFIEGEEIWLRKHDSFSDCEGREQAEEGNPRFVTHVTFFGHF
jgi:hypothetical protein